MDVDIEKTESANESSQQEINEEDQKVIEFEDQAYELDQAYQLVPEYH